MFSVMAAGRYYRLVSLFIIVVFLKCSLTVNTNIGVRKIAFSRIIDGLKADGLISTYFGGKFCLGVGLLYEDSGAASPTI